jgi:uncharacterized membrane protein required for colicin V production
MDLLDGLFLLILFFTAYKGYKKGFFATVSTVIGYVVAIIGTFVFYQPLAAYLGSELGLTKIVSPWVLEKLTLPAAAFQTQITEIAFDKAAAIINQQQLPEVFKKSMLEYVKDISSLPINYGINNLGDGIAFTISNFFITALSFFLLYGFLSLIFRAIIPKVFKTVSPKPIAFLDKLGGAVFGTCGGILSVAALVMILTPLASMGAMKGNSSPLANQMANSLFVNMVMSNIGTFIQ